MITEQEYQDIKRRQTEYAAAFEQITGGKRSYITAEERDAMPAITLDEYSAAEVYEFMRNLPDRYFAYVDDYRKRITTWTGETLGQCSLGYPYRSNMGDTRRSIRVHAINGREYAGTYYTSAGDYCRIRTVKTS